MQLNWTQIIIAGLNGLSRLKPSSSKPPIPPSISEVYQNAMASVGTPLIPPVHIDVAEQKPPSSSPQLPEQATSRDVATACISCSRSHLATVTGALGEAIRFAREGGIADPEVIKRIELAENEITIMERVDLSPASIKASPPEEQKMANDFLPRIRTLRQNIGNIMSVGNLEDTASEAEILGREFRLRHLEIKGVDVQGVMSLAKKVNNNEMTLEEAQEKIRKYLPNE